VTNGPNQLSEWFFVVAFTRRLWFLVVLERSRGGGQR
jgi:hypothetical protein